MSRNFVSANKERAVVMQAADGRIYCAQVVAWEVGDFALPIIELTLDTKLDKKSHICRPNAGTPDGGCSHAWKFRRELGQES